MPVRTHGGPGAPAAPAVRLSGATRPPACRKASTPRSPSEKRDAAITRWQAAPPALTNLGRVPHPAGARCYRRPWVVKDDTVAETGWELAGSLNVWCLIYSAR